MKKCKCCKERKDVGAFYSNAGSGGGVDYYCIQCRLKSTAASRKRRARRGPPCDNCGEKYVYYAKGLCGSCYVYEQRTGRPRPTTTDYAKTLIDWAYRLIRGEAVKDLADSSSYCEYTIRKIMSGSIEAEHWKQAYALLPDEMRKELKHSINGRLRPRDVRRIRELAANGHKQREIGELYNRTYSAISLIVNGKRYGYVT